MAEAHSPTSTKGVDEFARSLAREFADRFTLDMAAKKRDKKSERKLGVALNNVHVKAAAFHREHPLGVYRKARLGNTFKWELKEMGYSGDFVEEVTKGLIVNLSRK